MLSKTIRDSKKRSLIETTIDAGIGFVVENAEQLSKKINALGSQKEVKQKIEAFMQSQAGATNKIIYHVFIKDILK